MSLCKRDSVCSLSPVSVCSKLECTSTDVDQKIMSEVQFSFSSSTTMTDDAFGLNGDTMGSIDSLISSSISTTSSIDNAPSHAIEKQIENMSLNFASYNDIDIDSVVASSSCQPKSSSSSYVASVTPSLSTDPPQRLSLPPQSLSLPPKRFSSLSSRSQPLQLSSTSTTDFSETPDESKTEADIMDQLIASSWKDATEAKDGESFPFNQVAKIIFQSLFSLCPETKAVLGDFGGQVDCLSGLLRLISTPAEIMNKKTSKAAMRLVAKEHYQNNIKKEHYVAFGCAIVKMIRLRCRYERGSSTADQVRSAWLCKYSNLAEAFYLMGHGSRQRMYSDIDRMEFQLSLIDKASSDISNKT
eukprot:Awhi_evm1s11821